MQLYLIRHAQSENNALYIRTGSYEGRNPDPRLSEVGRAQANILARFLAQGNPETDTDQHDTFDQRGFGITHLYCSLLRRSIETALEIAGSIDVPAVAHKDLHEWGGVFRIESGGEYQGLPGPGRSFFETTYPELVLPETLSEEGWWNRPHEGKELAYERAKRFLEELKERHLGQESSVALVTHAGFFHSLMSLITELPLDQTNDRWLTRVLFAMNNAAITRVTFQVRGVVIHYMNRAEFLPRSLIT